MIKVSIKGFVFYSDLVGRLEDGRIACLGLVGRKTGLDKAFVDLYHGADVVIDGRYHKTLGEKAYRVYKTPLQSRRITRAYVMPTGAIASFAGAGAAVQEDDSDKKEDAPPPILLWREDEAIDSDERLWSHIRHNSAVPLLDEWREPVMSRLKPLAVEQKDDSVTQSSPGKAIAPISFDPAHDGQWRGVAIQLSEDQVKKAAWEALRAGEVTVPEGAKQHA